MTSPARRRSSIVSKQRHDAQRPRGAGLLLQQLDGQHVRRPCRHRDDVGAERRRRAAAPRRGTCRGPRAPRPRPRGRPGRAAAGPAARCSRNACRSASLHASYAPSPSSRVMAVKRLGVPRRVLAQVEPHERERRRPQTRRSRSRSRPSAMRPSPVSTSERWHRRSGSARSSARSTNGPAPRSACRRAAPRWSAASHARRVAHVAQQRAIRLVGVADARAQLGAARRTSRARSAARRPRAGRGSAACHRASRQAVSVTRAVTAGLPSRSPPIHEPNRMGAASSGRPRPVCVTSAASSTRRYRGSASHSVCSKTTRPDRTSSTGDGRSRRTSLVSHAAAISLRSASEQFAPLGHGEVGPIAQREQLGDAPVLLQQRAPRDLGRDAP